MNILYLFERECSIQRRHQKYRRSSLLLTPELRKKMGEAAVMVNLVIILEQEQWSFYWTKTIISFSSK
jgi:acetyl/propionyl-CoA carboxylase alpha subunit